MFGGGSEELPEIAKRLGQFKSEEAYLQFRAQWERAKQSAGAPAYNHQSERSSARFSFASRLARWFLQRLNA